MKHNRKRFHKALTWLSGLILILLFQNCSQPSGFQSSGSMNDSSTQSPSEADPSPTPSPSPAQDPNPAPTPIPSSAEIGWTELPGTAIENFAPANAKTDLRGATGIYALVNAWSGGIADVKRNRLIMWGGGHNDYYGNELYALDVGTGKMARITEPSPVDALWNNPNDPLNCPEVYSDGGPVSRHTYSGIAYVTSTDSLFAYSGSKATCGYGSSYTWNFSFSTSKWQVKNPPGTNPVGGYGIVADYDPNTDLVFVTAVSDGGVYSYNAHTNVYTKHSDKASMDYHMNGVIDPSRKIMVLMGPNIPYGGIKIIDLTPGGTYKMTDITSQTTGCEGLLTSSPGLAYDSSQKLIVGWPNKGNTVYIFNPDTKICTTKTFTNGPSGTDTGSEWGTFGRFRYFPSLDVFALVTNANKNAYILKLK